MPSGRTRVRLIRLSALSALLVVLVLSGRGPLALPLEPSAAWAWSGREPPIDVVFALLRLGALVTGGYLLAALVLVTAGEHFDHHPAGRLGRRMLPVSLHGLLALGAGAAAVTAVFAPAAGAAPAPTRAAVAAPSLVRLGSPDVPPPTLRRVVPPREPAERTSTTTTVPPTPTTTTDAPPSVPTTVPGTGAPDHRASPRPRAPRRGSRPDRANHRHAEHHPVRRRPEPAPAWVTVRAGDSFWSIASREVGNALGRSPTVGEVAPYWSRLMAANAGRLPVPGQPDVLFPGDRLILPPGAP